MSRPLVKSKAGKSFDLGDQHYRSKMERNVARYLRFLKETKQIKDWSYEKVRFDFIQWKHRGVTSYKPDFEIIENSGVVKYYEVKGFMDDKSQVKLNCMARYYPDVLVVVIDAKVYRSIRTLKGAIRNWE